MSVEALRAGRRWSRRRLLAIGVAAAVVVAGVAVTRFTGGAPASHASVHGAATTADVVRTDVAQTTPVSGTVGYASPTSIVQPSGTATTALTQAEQAVTAAQANMTADRTSVADTQASNAQSIDQAQQSLASARSTLTSDSNQLQADQSTLSAAQQKEASDCQGSNAASAASSSNSSSPSSSPCSNDASQVSSDQGKVTQDQSKVSQDQSAVQNADASLASAQQHASQGTHQADAKAAADQLQLSNAQAALATAEASAAMYGQTSKYTKLPTVGQVVSPGQVLWSVDATPVVLLAGATTAWRSFTAGMSPGPDVQELNQALIALGFGGGLTPSDQFTSGTAAGINRLQASLASPQTGQLPLGSVIFEPAPIRVTSVHPSVGAPVQGGTPVLDVSSTTAIVNIALAVDQTYLVKVGDPVSVTLPDGTTANGMITGVGTVATSTTNNNNGSSNPTATVNVTVSLTSASAAGTLDQAPVTVNITNASAHAVLAVPVAALVALAGGGYAVEVVAADGTHQLVAVTTGIFDDQAGVVQVTSSGLSPGQHVVVAS